LVRVGWCLCSLFAVKCQDKIILSIDNGKKLSDDLYSPHVPPYFTDALDTFVAKALGKIGPEAKEAVPALIQTLEDEDAWMCHAAAEALGEIGRKMTEE
jgi:HEAT repeat protein